MTVFAAGASRSCVRRETWLLALEGAGKHSGNHAEDDTAFVTSCARHRKTLVSSTASQNPFSVPKAKCSLRR